MGRSAVGMEPATAHAGNTQDAAGVAGREETGLRVKRKPLEKRPKGATTAMPVGVSGRNPSVEGGRREAARTANLRWGRYVVWLRVQAP